MLKFLTMRKRKRTSLYVALCVQFGIITIKPKQQLNRKILRIKMRGIKPNEIPRLTPGISSAR